MLTIAFMLQGERDDKIIAVCADDPEFRHYTDIKEIPPHRLAEIRRFFEDCILLNAFTLESIYGSWKHFVCFSSYLNHTFYFSLDISWTKKTRRTKTRKSMWKTSCQRRLPLMPSSTPCKLPWFFSDWPFCRVLGLDILFLFNSLMISTCRDLYAAYIVESLRQ